MEFLPSCAALLLVIHLQKAAAVSPFLDLKFGVPSSFREQQGPDKIFYGNTSSPHQWPWQVLLKADGRFTCGGVLVTRQHILTAAHCVDGSPRNYSVVLGEHSRQTDEGVEQRLKIQSILMHPKYSARRLKRDIAILTLETLATVGNGYVELVPRLSDSRLDGKAEKQRSHTCYVTGWGRTITENGDSVLADELQELVTNIQPHKLCKRKTLYAYRNQFNICTINTMGGFCNGDSGGPLVCQLEGHWTLMGLVSWFIKSNGCVKGAKVYTRISTYRDWILKKTVS